MLGEEYWVTIRACGMLAWANHAIGNLRAARPLGERAYTLSCQVHGEDHPETILALQNLAATMGEQGDVQVARELLEKALAANLRARPADQPDEHTLRLKHLLSHMLRALVRGPGLGGLPRRPTRGRA